MLEVSVALVHGAALATDIFSLVVGRLAVYETLSLIHESLAVVALGVLLHGHHGQLRLDLDRTPWLYWLALRCRRHRWEARFVLNLADTALIVRGCDTFSHRMHLLHRLIVVLLVCVSHRLVEY